MTARLSECCVGSGLFYRVLPNLPIVVAVDELLGWLERNDCVPWTLAKTEIALVEAGYTLSTRSPGLPRMAFLIPGTRETEHLDYDNP